MNCSVCKREIDPREVGDTWQKVVGWEKQRSAGGTNAIALRRPLQEWMCPTCMVRLKDGPKVNQGTLL